MSLNPRTVSATVRNAIGAHRATTERVTDTAVRVTVHGADGPTNDPASLARVVAAAAMQQGWDASRTGDTVLVTLPEPADEPDPRAILAADLADGHTTYVTGRWQTLHDVRHAPDGTTRARTDRGGELFIGNPAARFVVR